MSTRVIFLINLPIKKFKPFYFQFKKLKFNITILTIGTIVDICISMKPQCYPLVQMCNPVLIIRHIFPSGPIYYILYYSCSKIHKSAGKPIIQLLSISNRVIVNGLSLKRITFKIPTTIQNIKFILLRVDLLFNSAPSF